jgi:hypothetical protein
MHYHKITEKQLIFSCFKKKKHNDSTMKNMTLHRVFICKNPIKTRKNAIFGCFFFFSRPQAEEDILRVLVDKLGDTEKRIASKVVHLLDTLVEAHPAMKPTLARGVATLVHTPRVPLRGRCVAVATWQWCH